MLQRAASNAYSWWWASHVRTKQSKWLEQNLQDMGEKVEAVLKLIEEDGDSFIKKAEMYYKKRPEFINFVEESYRAYRSLAERYDILSKELQNANKTLASAFPDQYQYQIDDDDEDEDAPPGMPKKLPENPNIPEAPAKFPTKQIKAYMALTAKPKKLTKKGTTKPAANVQKSGLTKSEAIQEVDKLQKQILTLQTEKEFAKSSYESGHAKYWKIEEEIEGMQEKISKLQDEFEINQVIEDDEARTLMARSALKSCQETLAELQEKQEKAVFEAKAERERIKAAREKLMSLKGDNLAETYEIGDSIKEEDNWASFDEGSGELEKLRDTIKEHFDVGSTTSLTVSEMAEKVDELVNKVIDLETAVSSQTALIHRLRSETDDLQSQLKSFEDDKANLIDGKNTLDDKLREMENKLRELRDLDRSFESQNTSLETHFTEARSNIDTISEKLHNIRPDEEVEESSMFQETGGLTENDVKKEVVGDMKGNEMSTLVLSQDRERDEKVAQLEYSKASAPSRIDDSQLDEQPITKEDKSSSSTLDIAQPEEFPKENRPSTFDAVDPRELPKEYKSSTLDVSQPLGPPSELKPGTIFVAQPQEHATEHNPSNLGAAEPQEDVDRRDVEQVSSNEAQPQEHPKEYKLSTFDVVQQQEPPKGLEPSTLDVAQPQEHSMEHNSIIDVVGPQEDVDKRDVEVVSSNETQPQEHPKEYKLSTFDPPEQELPKRLKSSTLDVAQSQEFPMVSPSTLYDVAQQQDVELVVSDETPQREPAGVSASYNQEAQKRETESMMVDNKLNVSSSAKPQEQTRKEGDEPDWQQLFMNGLEGKEKILLAEYTSTLRNYKQAKKKLGEMEKKSEADFSEIAAQLQDLRSSNANKDDEIRALQHKLNILQKMMEEYGNSKEFKDVEPPTRNEEPSLPLDNEDIQVLAKAEEISPVEQKLRAGIDAVLEENLDFWMRVSASFSQVQKFQREVEDLHSEISKLEKEHEKKEGSGHGKSHMDSSMKSDIKPLYKHLREIQTSLTVWLDNSEKLKDELHSRFTELCNIQEEINQALNVGAEDEEMKFTSYQAAKFQGEVANMQQENHKVDDELQAGMDHITALQLEIDHTLARLNEELGLRVKSQSENEMKSRSNAKVPLRSFIFGDKPPKKKHSIFSLMHPIKHRKFQHLKSDKLP